LVFHRFRSILSPSELNVGFRQKIDLKVYRIACLLEINLG
jgi:hypothetical protein